MKANAEGEEEGKEQENEDDENWWDGDVVPLSWIMNIVLPTMISQ